MKTTFLVFSCPKFPGYLIEYNFEKLQTPPMNAKKSFEVIDLNSNTRI
jgi:hypothetical protein